MAAEKVAEKLVQIRLPKTENDDGMNFVPVCINGKITQIKRGETVEVSQTIANILTEAGYLDR